MAVICEKSIGGKVWISDGNIISENIIDSILEKRGIITHAEKEAFLKPSIREQLPNPSIIKGMDNAAKIVANSITSNEKIAIFGDYDVDGITSTALLIKFFRRIGIEPLWRLPDRESEGYGLNESAVRDFAESGVKTLITVDCGITAVKEAKLAKELGLKIIITDHHNQADYIPDADAVVNPKQQGDDSGLTYMAGCGVAFMFLVALNRELGHPVSDLMEFLDLVAIGTICDTMPIIGLNRAFVTSGLRVLSKQNNIGLKALSEISKVKKFDTYSIGFILGPRLNAAGRIMDANIALDLLLTDNFMIANEQAEKLNDMNSKRQSIQSAILTEADDMAKAQADAGNFCLFITGDNWHSGVMGIVAGRLKEKYNMPCLVGTKVDNVISGSGRSITDVDLGKIIHLALEQDIITSGGGHSAAAGFEMDSCKESIFYEMLNAITKETLSGKCPVPKINIDLEMDAGGANLELAEKLSELAPFGIGNHEPVICLSSGIWTFGRTIGQGGNHISGNLKTATGNLPVIAFNISDSDVGKFLLDEANFNTKIRVVGKLKVNDFNGGVQMFLEDISL